jgi:hypothetical protein
MVKSEPEAYSFAQFRRRTRRRRGPASGIIRRASTSRRWRRATRSSSTTASATRRWSAWPRSSRRPIPIRRSSRAKRRVGLRRSQGRKGFPHPVSLEAIKAHRTLKDLLLVRQSRLSVMPLERKGRGRTAQAGRSLRRVITPIFAIVHDHAQRFRYLLSRPLRLEPSFSPLGQAQQLPTTNAPSSTRRPLRQVPSQVEKMIAMAWPADEMPMTMISWRPE